MGTNKYKSETATLTLEQKALLYAEMTNSIGPEDFGLTLEGRFLPKWLKESGVHGQFTYETALGTLDRKAVHKLMTDMTVEQMSSFVGRARPALAELEAMKVKWDARSNDSGRGGSVHKNEAIDNPEVGTAGEDRTQAGEPVAVPKGRAVGNAGRSKGSKGGAA